MPTYEYECEACGIRFERVQTFSEEPLKRCPECKGAIHRRFLPPVILFKGSGFYKTDYGSSLRAQPSSKSEDSDSDSKGESKSEKPKSEADKDKAKPESKSETKEKQAAKSEAKAED